MQHSPSLFSISSLLTTSSLLLLIRPSLCNPSLKYWHFAKQIAPNPLIAKNADSGPKSNPTRAARAPKPERMVAQPKTQRPPPTTLASSPTDTPPPPADIFRKLDGLLVKCLANCSHVFYPRKTTMLFMHSFPCEGWISTDETKSKIKAEATSTYFPILD